jgi:hypothetical protein
MEKSLNSKTIPKSIVACVSDSAVVMKTVNSVSGGKTSAKLMIDFPADYNIFQLVRTNNPKALFMKGKDEKTRQLISDRIGFEFIGTLEQDTCIYTILDLEQFTGQEIKINTSKISFDEMIAEHGTRCLPSPLRRYCTEELKMKVAFEWWQENINEIVEMRIGYRANEMSRMARKLKTCDENRIESFKHVIGFKETKKGTQQIWETTKFSKPVFPFIENKPTWKDEIEIFWKNKPVRFAEFNNCVGCFHREPLLLKYMWKEETEKMQIFSDFEKNRKYKNDTFFMDDKITYERIKNMNLTHHLVSSDFNECDSGYCGI